MVNDVGKSLYVPTQLLQTGIFGSTFAVEKTDQFVCGGQSLAQGQNFGGFEKGSGHFGLFQKRCRIDVVVFREVGFEHQDGPHLERLFKLTDNLFARGAEMELGQFGTGPIGDTECRNLVADPVETYLGFKIFGVDHLLAYK